MTWRRLLEEIASLTDLPLPKDSLSTTTDDLHVYSRQIRQMTERLRKYVEGPSRKNFHRHQELRDDIFPYVIDFLVHPEGGGIAFENIMKPDISLEAAHHMAAFLFDTRDFSNTHISRFRHNSYWAICRGSRFTEIAHLCIDNGDRFNNLPYSPLFLRTFSAETEEIAQIAHGWLLYLPDQSVIATTKNIVTNENTILRSIGVRSSIQHSSSELFLISGQAYVDALRTIDPRIIELLVDLARETAPRTLESLPFGRKILQSTAQNTLIFQDIDDFSSLLRNIHNKISEERERKLEINLLFSSRTTQESKDIVHRMGESEYSLSEAVQNNDLDGFNRLLKSGADPNRFDPETGLTPLHFIAGLARKEFLRVIIRCNTLQYAVRDKKGRLPSDLAIEGAFDSLFVRFLSRKEQGEIADTHLDLP